MNDFFKSFFEFGSRSEKRNPDDLYRSRQWDTGNDFNFYDQSKAFGFGTSTDDAFSTLMEDFMSTFSQDFGMFPAFPGIGVGEGNGSQKRTPERSLRDQILKNPEEDEQPSYHHREPPSQSPNHRFFGNDSNIDSLFDQLFGRSFVQPFSQSLPKEDTDLDSDIQKQGLDSILKKDDSREENSSRLSPFSHSTFRSESRSKIKRADGSSEERVTRRSPDGTEVTIITETPSGERRTEIHRSDGTVEVEGDDISSHDNSLDLSSQNHTWHTPFFTDTMFPSINSFFNYFFGK